MCVSLTHYHYNGLFDLASIVPQNDADASHLFLSHLLSTDVSSSRSVIAFCGSEMSLSDHIALTVGANSVPQNTPLKLAPLCGVNLYDGLALMMILPLLTARDISSM